MKWIVRILGILLLVILVAGAALFFIPADRIAQIAADQIEKATGRDVTISGDVSMTLWPVLGVSANGLEVGNADWAKDGPMLTAENASIGVDAAALLQGEIKIRNIEAVSPTIRLEQKADGRASWEFTDASGEAAIETETSPDREPQAFSIERLSVQNATLVYDAEGSDLVSYSGVDLTLDWPERLGPAEISAVLRPQGAPVEVDATIEQFSGFIAGQVQPVNVKAQAAGGSVTVVGRASTAGEVAAKVDLSLPDTDAFMQALALPAPGLPQGMGRSVNGSMDLTLTADRRLSLRDLGLDLGQNRIAGAADISLNGTPQVNAQLNAGTLDLRPLTASSGGGSGSGGGGSSSAGSGWPKDRIDASGLAAFNGDIALRADKVVTDTLQLGATTTVLRNDRSRMVFELRDVRAYDGQITGEFVMNNRNGLSVGGKINASGLGLQGILTDMAGIDRLTGAAEANLQFLGVGDTVDAIMRSLSGQGSVKVGSGTILGIDLDQLMRTGDGSGGTTIFDSLSASYTMENGNLFNRDLLLALRNFEARGDGRVGLGAQDLDYLFTPVALRANEGRGVAIPVRIRGPWSGPRILPDLEAALDLNFKEEVKKLEETAKQKIEEKVAEELGVSVDEGQSIEDAVKDKAEDALKKGLKSLFD